MPEIIKDLIRRDISQKVEGVVKVFDRSALASEIREYVVTDKIEDEIKKIVDTFTQASDVLRRGGHHRDVMGIWISGFFGSGKSHFAKVLGYLLQNEPLVAGGEETCIDAFEKHLSESHRGRDIRLRLGEIKKTTSVKTIAFEIRSRQSLTNPNSVGEILLGEFYRAIGYSENFVIARIERRLDKKGMLQKLHQAFQQRFGIPWDDPEGRDDLATVRRRLSKVLPEVDPKSYPTEDDALGGLDDAFEHSKITAESIADDLVAWVDEQKPSGGKVQHLVFVVDEMGTFIGDSNEKIGELNSLAEMIGNKGKGKVWIIATSQQDLEKVVDRTNFDPVLVGRLNARFELKPHLISDGINKVVSERILKKHPHKEAAISAIFKEKEGALAQLSDLRASRSLGLLTERAFIDAYPFLPHQIQLAQDIGEALSGFRISGGVRSMISVIMETLQKLASNQIPTIASFDQVFDALENDLYSQEYLGTAGVKAIYDANDRIGKETPLPPARVLKVLYLVQHVTFVPLTAENIAKLLAARVDDDVKLLTDQVEQTLDALQQAGYVSRDEATGEWKFLNEKERTVEQVIQEMMRPGSSKSVTQTAIRQQSIDLIKLSVIAKKNLDNYAVLHGATKTPFGFGVSLDGESVDSGSEIEVHFVSPLAPGRKTTIEDLKRENQAAGARGRRIGWVAALPDKLEIRLKRYQALVNITSDKRFTEDLSKDTAGAMAEKRKERDMLKGNLTKDLQATFLTGTLCFAGRELTLERSNSMAEEIRKAVAELIPNIYPRFNIADKPVDFAKQLKALLNPSQSSLHGIASDLHLFDTQGSLQKESALVATVLDVIKDLENEGHDPTGDRLLDERNASGFKGFSRAPFAWPSETVRLVLAACFRAGAIFLERATAAGPAPLYDYKDAFDDFSKIKTFEKTLFRLAETSLSVEQIKQASKDLIALGITGTPESGNALATAVRKLGEKLLEAVRDAEVRSEGGLPILDCILNAEPALKEPTTLRDPTKAVIAFLAKAPAWLEIKKSLDDLKSFLDANRHKEFETSRQLVALVTDHPLPADSEDKEALEHSLADIDTLISAKTVVPSWSDHRAARDQIFQIYSTAYRQSYDKLRASLAAAVASIRQGKAYEAAPADKRDGVLHATFGSGGACHLPEVSITTLPALLSSAAKTSLSSLAQAEKALPIHRAEVESALRALRSPPPPPKKGEKTYTWHSSSALAGRRFASENDVDAALQEVGDDLKKRIREGFVIDTI
ncbi:MAG: BREX system P-loop protein BrxC [Verrucomicrobia bacterium]|nr:BREX system P-loop protein BrxC [Verrucomicrobiota bacterium]